MSDWIVKCRLFNHFTTVHGGSVHIHSPYRIHYSLQSMVLDSSSILSEVEYSSFPQLSGGVA